MTTFSPPRDDAELLGAVAERDRARCTSSTTATRRGSPRGCRAVAPTGRSSRRSCRTCSSPCGVRPATTAGPVTSPRGCGGSRSTLLHRLRPRRPLLDRLRGQRRSTSTRPRSRCCSVSSTATSPAHWRRLVARAAGGRAGHRARRSDDERSGVAARHPERHREDPDDESKARVEGGIGMSTAQWHVDPADLAAYGDGWLSGVGADSTEAHLLRCATCRSVLAARLDDGRPRSTVGPIAAEIDRPTPMARAASWLRLAVGTPELWCRPWPCSSACSPCPSCWRSPTRAPGSRGSSPSLRPFPSPAAVLAYRVASDPAGEIAGGVTDAHVPDRR